VHRPRLLFLDEPTVGLDVVSAHALRALIGRLRDEGVTIFLTTHYLEEAERLADRVALIVQGRIVVTDTVEGLKVRAGHEVKVEVRLADPTGEGEEWLRFPAGDVEASVRVALAHAEAEGKRVVSINTVQSTLEDAFIELTGLSAEVMRAEKGNR